jgi:hypothetical protein
MTEPPFLCGLCGRPIEETPIWQHGIFDVRTGEKHYLSFHRDGCFKRASRRLRELGFRRFNARRAADTN